MRLRGWIVLLTTLIAMALSADGCALLLVGGGERGKAAAPPSAIGASAIGGGADPGEVASDYFAAWEHGDLSAMELLVSGPAPDFVQQHEALSRALRVSSVRFRPGPVVRQATAAHVDFTVTRELTGVGTWSYGSTLNLARVGGRWMVVWSPATLHPRLKPGGALRMSARGGGDRLLDRDGRRLPGDTTAGPYLDELTKNFVAPGTDRPTWTIEVRNGSDVQRLKTFPGRPAKRTRTTLDRRLQAAADRAVAGASGPAAIVAVRPSSGEILAVGDRLGGRAAFLGQYPPGSSFKVVTAAALLASGMSPRSSVDCPEVAHIGQRTIANLDRLDLGRTSLRKAFADSCNTTFARLAAERIGGSRLAREAAAFGFGGPLAPGVPAARGSCPVPGGTAELAEDAFGQGRVLASPLGMALVAAAAAGGTWRPPRLVPTRLLEARGEPAQRPHTIPHAAELRSMMRAVVTDGTAARGGLPPGVSGKTGTAEYGPSGGSAHAWFIGFEGDLAFSAFVAGGGWGAAAAAPLAAAFLRGGR
ncbi:MAG TPA: penicillin-binding transpeptidase domain-containing protein [Streptosporangiaceae bacterium]